MFSKELEKAFNEQIKWEFSEFKFPLEVFLQWFLSEQVEEETSFESIVEKLKMTEDSLQGILFIDKELGQRSFDLNQIFASNK